MTGVVVTGAAGFIGFHAALRLLRQGLEVVGVDNMSPYYDVALKKARLGELAAYSGFRFEQIELANSERTIAFLREARPKQILHLAAQAGVRYSSENPQAFVQSNLLGFSNVLEGAREAGVGHVVFASSSSVYGASDDLPFHTDQRTDHPLSIYAATKKSNEMLAHSYAHVFALPLTGLRFFTVYGPWGRPDMAYYSFVRKLYAGEPIDVFAGGAARRDYTYVDDVVESIVRIMPQPPEPGSGAGVDGLPASRGTGPYRLYNIGNHTPVRVDEMIDILERHTGRKAIRREAPLPLADVLTTWADVRELAQATGYSPSTPLDEGLAHFVDWYRKWHGVR